MSTWFNWDKNWSYEQYVSLTKPLTLPVFQFSKYKTDASIDHFRREWAPQRLWDKLRVFQMEGQGQASGSLDEQGWALSLESLQMAGATPFFLGYTEKCKWHPVHHGGPWGAWTVISNTH